MIAFASFADFVAWWRGLRFSADHGKRSIGWQIFGSGYMEGEVGYLYFKWSPLAATIEFPSDWHEHRRVWIYLGLLFVRFGVSFRWRGEVVADEGQCSGPMYGFTFHKDLLWFYHGKDTGMKGDGSRTTFHMPWGWDHVGFDFLWPDGRVHHRAKPGEYGPPIETQEQHRYTYVCDDGEVQTAIATISGQRSERCMRALRGLRFTHRFRRSIDVQFKPAIGDRGVFGCGWEWRKGETMLEALRRMERDRRFK